MTWLLLALLAGHGFGALAQTGRFSAGVLVSGDTYELPYTLDAPSPYKSVNRLRISTGITMRYRVREKLGLKLGILYSDKGNSIVIDINSPYGYWSDYDGPKKVKQIRRHLDLPLLVTFQANKGGKVRLLPAAGFINSILLYSKAQVTYQDGKVVLYNDEPTYLVQRHILGAVFELGVAYQPVEELNFVMSPYYRTRIPFNFMPFEDQLKSYGWSLEALYCF